MNRRIIWAWCMYDWANSAYPLVISTALFPVYFTIIARDHAHSTIVTFAGLQWESASLYSLAIAVSYGANALLVPVLSGIADWGGRKKMFLRLFCTVGSLSCGFLALTDRQHLWLGICAAIVASIGFNGSLVFYNAFLPEIAPPRFHDRISARGYMFGYVGSSLLLIAVVGALQLAPVLGIAPSGETAFLAVAPWSFLAVGAWWYAFAQITLHIVPEHRVHGLGTVSAAIQHGIGQLLQALRIVVRSPVHRTFLASYLAASMGVQSVIMVASVYGNQELSLSEALLVGIILLVQFVAALGSWLWSRVSEWLGNTRALVLITMVWMLVCIAAYAITTVSAFVILSATVGLVLGGIQSQMRSTFSKLIAPEQAHAALFSLYDIAEKLGTMAGMGMFSAAVAVTGSLRIGALVLGAAFVLAALLLVTVHRRASASPAWARITQPRRDR
mgnify:CR=1 FL=1